MAGPRDDVAEALGRAASIAGPEVLRQPRRLRAVLADLVGRPGGDHRAEIAAVVAAAGELAGEGRRHEDEVVAALGRRGIHEATARWAVAALRAHEPESPGRRARPRGRRRWWLPIPAVGAAAAVVLVLSSWPDGADDADTPVPGSTTTSATTSAPASGPGFRVRFEDANEGAFRVSRAWEIGEGRVTGTVVLTATAGGGAAQHRELVPAEAFVDVVFTPEPDGRVGDVAVFNISDPAGGALSITFEASLTDAEPDEARVRSWVDLWRDRVVALRPLDLEPPAGATVAPLG